ncbi:ubiquinone biosynthesis regulatory protein kinase UbiB, partial [Klebsiella pneumoniae]|nr:ubiquinone biosynthesis regulatory protein kinase UbiB [Klebsiella pneumoniae]
MKTILRTLYLYRLAELFAALVRPGWARTLLKMLPQSSEFENEPLAVRLRLSLESLGPIFIKFGQVLSTRPDLIPHDYAVELARLQDKVPPFD